MHSFFCHFTMATFKHLYLHIIIFCITVYVLADKASDKSNKLSATSGVADDKSDKVVDYTNDDDLPELEDLEEEVWPPKGVSLSDDPAKWPGHQEPFGSKGRIHNVDIYKHFPKPTRFFREYVAPYIPLMMRGATLESTAFKKWADDDYFLNLPQSHTHWTSSGPTHNITFMKFITDYKTKKLVYDKEVPAFLSEDVPIPSSLLCDPVIKSFSTSILNIYGYDYSSPISRRNVDAIHCVFAGKQDFVLVSNIDFGDVMPHDFEKVDVKKVNYKQFPTLREAEYHKVTVNAGDCIFIPIKWYWQQNSIVGTKSVDVTWQHKIKNVKSSECSNYTAPPTLDMASFPDQKNHIDPKVLIAVQHFSSYLVSSPSLTYEHFETELKLDKKLLSNMINWTDEFEEITAEVFQLLDVNSDKSFSLTDLELITPQKLTHLHLHLDDLLADYQDILTDQQEEAKELQDTKPKQVADDAVKDQMGDYMKILENVIAESIEEFTATGKLPDMEKKLNQKISSKDGKISSEKPTKTAREQAKEKLQGKKKKVDGSDDAEEFTEAEENYKVIDESVVEEIIVDDDETEVSNIPGKQGSKKEKLPDTEKKVEQKEKLQKQGEKKEKEDRRMEGKKKSDVHPKIEESNDKQKEKKPEKREKKENPKKEKTKREEL